MNFGVFDRKAHRFAQIVTNQNLIATLMPEVDLEFRAED